MSKYDWSNVDSRLSFLATDCDGLVYGFTHKPKLTDWGFAPTNGFSKQVYGVCCGFGFGREWRESLEERPKEPAMSEFKNFQPKDKVTYTGVLGDEIHPEVYEVVEKKKGFAGMGYLMRNSQGVVDFFYGDNFVLANSLQEDLGDDYPIENHISPNCKVSD
ncbi:hypothetical protein [Acinetobacter lactucae]|uniref:hypothetical protein n=1 Tax=Acinetobacter lactucae TaxID=1785128 RepID=UPI001580031C|nr:hypothetical protein [Acinetobacter lactucae]NUG21183.1 hypothetical protein [Acinetobacter lactucae]